MARHILLRTILQALVLAVAASCFFGCGAKKRQNAALQHRPNIILVTFDTLRADFLGCYGNTLTRTPTFDALARHAAVFDRAYSAIPFTAPSLWALLHSLRIATHTYQTDLSVKYRSAQTLAGRLASAGYRTVGFTGSSNIRGALGFSKGFDRYFDTWSEPWIHNETTLARVQQFAASELGGTNATQPFFLYVHFFDPHGTWGDAPPRFRTYPPEPSHFARLPATRSSNNSYGTVRSQARFALSLMDYLGINSITKIVEAGTAKQYMIPMYRSEITWSDDVLARLLRTFRELRLLDHSLVIVSADHGIAFGEHFQRFGYVFSLFDEATHVPLLILPPDQQREVHIDGAVSLIDIGPTILDYAGAGTQLGDGTSLRPMIEGKQAGEERIAYAETTAIPEATYLHTIFAPNPMRRYAVGVRNRHSMLVKGTRKLIYMPSREGRKFELFDTRTDPLEHTDIFSSSSPSDRSIAVELLRIRASLEQNYGAAKATQSEELLRKLGYIQ